MSPRYGLVPTKPGMPGYTDDLRIRAQQVLDGTSLVEVILYGHLLLEQALDLRIQACFKRPNAMQDGSARLSFAHKVTVYVGLYDPDEQEIRLLRAFNKLRNQVAHTFNDLEDATLQCLPNMPGDTALDRVKIGFLWLTYFEFKTVGGVRRLDLVESGNDRSGED